MAASISLRTLLLARRLPVPEIDALRLVVGALLIGLTSVAVQILVPLADAAGRNEPLASPGGAVLDVGVPVRAIRDPYFGQLGTVVALPSDPRVLESGSRARVVDVAFESGGTATLPRANVEILEG